MKRSNKNIQILKTLFLCAAFFLFSFATAKARPGDDYSPEKAIAYADSCFKLENGKYTPNPSSVYGRELCAGYVSQCLREGGMSEDSSWYWHGIGKTPDAWRLSHSLYNHLKKCGYQIIDSPKTTEIEIGDVIFYYTGSKWGHCAICVGKNSKGTPLINAYNNPHCHYSNWRLNYKKICVVSMSSRTQTPEIEENTLVAGKEITLSCATSGSTIYYTTNGKDPTKNSTVYKKPFTLKKSSEIRAFAVSKKKASSRICSLYINTERVLPDSSYLILLSDDSSKALEIASSSTKEDAAVTIGKKSENYSQKFSLTYGKDGCYTITSLHSELFLTETAADSICQEKASKKKNQQWHPICTGKNKFVLQNADTTHYLTFNKASSGEKVYSVKDIQQAKEFTFTHTKRSEVTLTAETLPEKITYSHPFVFYGKLTSNYDLVSVEITILNAKKKKVVSVSDTPHKKSYELFTLSPKIKFGKLSVGTYSFVITVQDETTHTEKIVNKTFKVTK